MCADWSPIKYCNILLSSRRGQKNHLREIFDHLSSKNADSYLDNHLLDLNQISKPKIRWFFRRIETRWNICILNYVNIPSLGENPKKNKVLLAIEVRTFIVKVQLLTVFEMQIILMQLSLTRIRKCINERRGVWYLWTDLFIFQRNWN